MKSRLRHARARLAAHVAPAPPLADVLAAFNDAVVVLDHEQRVVLFNPAAEELVGVPQRRALGEPCARLFPDTPLIGEMVDRVIRLGQSESRTDEGLMRGRRQVPVRVGCAPLWERDRVSGAVLVIHDLGSQRTLEDSARRHESLARLGTLVAGLAHEVRNPLAGIKGAAQLLQHHPSTHPDLAEYTTVITREVNRLSALVEDLLTLGAPPKPRLATVNVHRILQEVVAVVEPELARANLRLQFAFDPSLPDLQADDAQLSQVFLNLLRNAQESMTGGGGAEPERNTITIGTRMETDFHIQRDSAGSRSFLRVEIADQGCGIDTATAAQMFEPFFTTKARGTGLGLAISSKIVSEHGGIMRAAPNHPFGTVITVSLPVAKG
ncbi:MAG TPA: ATP-binding protein [Candidatus Dormibacteraeota bacterium]|nr:ATP-binding protein [Candidatus Dormibacteraeota bacterium]